MCQFQFQLTIQFLLSKFNRSEFRCQTQFQSPHQLFRPNKSRSLLQCQLLGTFECQCLFHSMFLFQTLFLFQCQIGSPCL